MNENLSMYLILCASIVLIVALAVFGESNITLKECYKAAQVNPNITCENKD